MLAGAIDRLADLPAPLILLVVGVAAILEGAVLAGLVLPGELVLLLGGSLAASGETPVALVWLIASTCSVGGDLIGYAVGRRSGGRLRTCRLGRWVGERRWSAAEAALARAGGRGVFAGKFVGVVRPLVPPLAGALGMPRRRFVVGSVLGSAAWAGLLVALGAVAGSSATALANTLGRIGWTAVAVVVPVVACVAVTRRRSARAALAGVERSSRQAARTAAVS
jgi:membrane protein DedA with SNARE-associated domain